MHRCPMKMFIEFWEKLKYNIKKKFYKKYIMLGAGLTSHRKRRASVIVVTDRRASLRVSLDTPKGYHVFK